MSDNNDVARDLAEDVLLTDKRLTPAIKGQGNQRIVIGEMPFAVGYSNEAYGQLGGDVDSLREAREYCPSNDIYRNPKLACITYRGQGNESVKPEVLCPPTDADGNPLEGKELEAAIEAQDHTGFYQRLALVPVCFKVDHFQTRVTNLTSAEVVISIGDDTDPNDPDNLIKHAEELTIPPGESRTLATDNNLPIAYANRSIVGSYVDEDGRQRDTNCDHWITACFANDVPKGEEILIDLVGSVPCN